MLYIDAILNGAWRRHKRGSARPPLGEGLHRATCADTLLAGCVCWQWAVNTDEENRSMTCTALYPGTFDPITNGHIDLIKRAAPLFNHMHVAVANPSHKKPCLAREKRISLIQIALRALPFNISVIPLNGLLVNCMREQQAKVILRGVRAVSDFDYEFQMASMNRTMCPELETLFLTPAEEYANISSSMVREIARLGGDISAFVPHCVVHCVQNALAGKHGHGT